MSKDEKNPENDSTEPPQTESAQNVDVTGIGDENAAFKITADKVRKFPQSPGVYPVSYTHLTLPTIPLV